MVLRCTARLLQVLGAKDATLARSPPDGEDWYANLLWVDRRKCLLLTHAATLFPVFVADVHKRDLREIGPFVIGHLHAELGQEGIGPEALGALDHGSVRLARTASRSVLSVMNDSASHIRFHVEQEGGLAAVDLDALNHRLRRTLHGRDGDYVVPLDLAAERAVGRRSSVESVQRIEPRRLRSSDDADSQP